MRAIILSAAVALGMGAASIVPAAAQVKIQAPGFGDRDCRTVEKRVQRNGRTVVSREKRCDGDRRAYRHRNDRYVERREYRDRDDRYVERRDYRRDSRPGVTLDFGR